MKKYLLIGGSIATEGAIEGILSGEKNADITVICGEKRPLYSRPLISYALEKKTTDDKMYFHGEDYYEKKGILRQINGIGTVESIFDELCKVVAAEMK